MCFLNLDWRWSPNCQNEIYKRILQMFADKKSANYSIQQIGTPVVADK